ncbi:hypothetical protein QR680_011155 [Steinernema hermaphroditum]|uniref:Uncharacterized protein n=1 Tax=Steinernema hermaphroditum TaxID=289476 RepID=A0AA39IST3_9BILA|nr:hypothetical protein QR680_011155 [Steinernema hermaphroditum]
MMDSVSPNFIDAVLLLQRRSERAEFCKLDSVWGQQADRLVHRQIAITISHEIKEKKTWYCLSRSSLDEIRSHPQRYVVEDVTLVPFAVFKELLEASRKEATEEDLRFLSEHFQQCKEVLDVLEIAHLDCSEYPVSFDANMLPMLEMFPRVRCFVYIDRRYSLELKLWEHAKKFFDSEYLEYVCIGLWMRNTGTEAVYETLRNWVLSEKRRSLQMDFVHRCDWIPLLIQSMIQKWLYSDVKITVDIRKAIVPTAESAHQCAFEYFDERRKETSSKGHSWQDDGHSTTMFTSNGTRALTFEWRYLEAAQNYMTVKYMRRSDRLVKSFIDDGN